jgi:hypothetical protein
LLTVPTAGDTDHVTLVLLDPTTVALMVAAWPPVSEAVVGNTVIDTECTNDIEALAVLVVSAVLVAVTVTVCDDVTNAGAVYTPLAMVPTAGDMVQLTAGFPVPVTVGVKVFDCPEVSDALDGASVMETGTRDNTALAVAPGEIWLAAFTVTVWAAEIGEGAVYVPLAKVPTCRDMDHVMVVLVFPVTVPFSAVDWPATSEVEVGLSVTDTVGTSAIVAVAVLLGFATLFAVTVTFCAEVSVVGTVYTPWALMLP